MARSDFPRFPQLVTLHKAHRYINEKFPCKTEHGYWIDGYPVTERIYVFCTAYRLSSPHVKFFGSADNARDTLYAPDGQRDENGRIRLVGHVFTDMFVYTDSSEYIMARVMYDSESGFGIEAHKIVNKRFSDSNAGYRKLWSEDVRRAVKNANTFVTPWSLAVVAGRSSGNFASHSKRPLSNAESRLTKLGRLDGLMLAQEIINLSKQGVQFLSAEVQEFANNAQEYLDEYNALKRYKGDAVFVSIRILKNGSQIADIGHANAYDFRRDDMTFKSEPVESLDPDFAGKLAALSMVEVGKYIENIGYRVTEQSFWIECRDV